MRYRNPYYGQCAHLTFVYPKTSALCNSYAKVKAMCKIYHVDVYSIKRPDEIELCCVSLSPYALLNCAFFKNKKFQTQLEDFNNDNGKQCFKV